jgi:Cu(I)/Ag(I) efflux system periplasmic protein CusF
MIRSITLLLAALMTTVALADGQLPKVDAEVRRVDAGAGKVTLRHGEIPNLNMPPMTMVFQVDNPGLLEGIAVGDKLLVTVDQIDGAYTVLSVEPGQ